MPAVAEYARPTSQSEWPFVATESSLQPQGPEGQQLRRKVDEAIQHWAERAEFLLGLADEGDFVAYVSVPPNRTFYVATRYIYEGRGEPLPFVLDRE